MSITATTWAWSLDIPATVKLVLLSLAEHHNNKDGRCFPSHRRIMDWTKLSESAVRRAIRFLDKAGLISREVRTAKSGRTWGVQYALSFTREAVQEAKKSAAATETSRLVDPPEEAPEPHHGVVTSDHPKKNRKQETENGIQRQTVPSSPSAAAAGAQQDVSAAPLPTNWKPSWNHVATVARRCACYVSEQTAIRAHAHRLDLNRLIDEFARCFTYQVAREFAAWARSKKRTSDDWNTRFSEWLRVEFERNMKFEPTIAEVDDDRDQTYTWTADRYIWNRIDKLVAGS